MPDPQSEGLTLPTLVMIGGALDGTTYPLATSGDVVLGSGMDADVQIMLGNVEPLHARLTLSPSGLTIGDAGSATGTFVNGEKVEDSQSLQQGDRVCLGPPGAKGSAKLLVLIPSGWGASATPDAGGSEDVSPFLGGEPGPLIIDDGEPPQLAFEVDPEPSPPSEEPPLGTPPAFEEPSTGDEILAAEVVVEDGTSDPPLMATEAPPDDETAALFDEPLPPPLAPAPPSEATSHPPQPPPPPPPAAPPPRPPREGPLLTAPPPRDTEASTEAPTHEAPEEARTLEAPREPAPRRPPARGRPRGRRRRGGRRSRGPSLPVLPVLGALAAIGLLAAAGWWFFLRATPLALSAVNPTTVESGQAATLTGHGFAADPAGNTVLFGAQQAAVTAATDSQLTVVVPDGLGDAPTVPVVVRTAAGSSQPVSVGVLHKPRVTALEPDVALSGESIVIRGERLIAPVSVTIGNVAAEITEASGETVRVVVPELALPEGQKTEVVVRSGDTAATPAELIIGRLPLVLEVRPSSGEVGESVVVTGRGFDPRPAGNTVTFGSTPALVLAAAPAELTVVAPTTIAGPSPDVPVVVTVNGRASSESARFTPRRMTTSIFRPRFFAAPVPEYPDEPYVFVSTQLGPVLLLGGPGQSPSTAVRAAEAAGALNALVEVSASKEVGIEQRGDAVGVKGQGGPLLVATGEDAAAYGKPWEAGARSGPRVSPQILARHWAAVLQDYVDLFLYRRRALEVLALSPRGEVFKEIYGESVRRTPEGGGVATSIVYPTSERLAKGLRAAALVPSGGSARREVAVEGRWSGMLEDPETGAYRFEVRFGREGSGLAGSITAWHGEIEARSPLRDIRYRGHTLQFTADLRGNALEFEGELDDARIEGTARQQGRPSATFAMKLVE